MRVATFNIHHGAGIDGRYDLERIAELIRSFDADLVSLQELDVGWDRSGGDDQPDLLAAALGAQVVFHPTVERAGGARYGIAVMSRLPIETRAVSLPQGAETEPRAALIASSGSLTFIATHLTRDRISRARQLSFLAGVVEESSGPVVLAGDLNSPRRGLSPLFEAGLATHRGTVRTMPARFPRGQIDHVLAGRGASVASAWSLRTRASDHRPLVAEIGVPLDI